jgi:hypothetical protein
MTPKEKAIELVDEFKNIDIEYNDSIEGNCFMTMTKSDAKQCALIAVDEIINSNPTSQLSDPFLGNRTYENVNYWKEVKQELEKL